MDGLENKMFLEMTGGRGEKHMGKEECTSRKKKELLRKKIVKKSIHKMY